MICPSLTPLAFLAAPLSKQKAILRCFVAGAKANPKERQVEVAFYEVPFPRDADSRVPYVAMPEVRSELRANEGGVCEKSHAAVEAWGAHDQLDELQSLERYWRPEIVASISFLH